MGSKAKPEGLVLGRLYLLRGGPYPEGYLVDKSQPLLAMHSPQSDKPFNVRRIYVVREADARDLFAYKKLVALHQRSGAKERAERFQLVVLRLLELEPWPQHEPEHGEDNQEAQRQDTDDAEGTESA